MNEVLNKIVLVLTKPKDFYAGLAKEDGVNKAFIYYAGASLFSVFAIVVMYVLLEESMTSLFSRPNNIPNPFGTAIYILPIIFGVVGYTVGLGVSFITGAIMAGWLWLFGGRKGYAKAYQLSMYSSTPGLILGWVPYVGGLIAYTWGIVLLVIGTKEIYKFSTRKAIVVHLVPSFLMLLLVIAIGIVAAFGIAALGLTDKLPTTID